MGKDQRFEVRLSKEDMADLERLAKYNRVSKNATIGILIRNAGRQLDQILHSRKVMEVWGKPGAIEPPIPAGQPGHLAACVDWGNPQQAAVEMQVALAELQAIEDFFNDKRIEGRTDWNLLAGYLTSCRGEVDELQVPIDGARAMMIALGIPLAKCAGGIPGCAGGDKCTSDHK